MILNASNRGALLKLTFDKDMLVRFPPSPPLKKMNPNWLGLTAAFLALAAFLVT